MIRLVTTKNSRVHVTTTAATKKGRETRSSRIEEKHLSSMLLNDFKRKSYNFGNIMANFSDQN